MEKFIFRVISNNPDYNNMTNVIEMVESEEGDLSYVKMEKTVDFLIGIGLIPSEKTEVYGEVTIFDNSITVEILDLID